MAMRFVQFVLLCLNHNMIVITERERAEKQGYTVDGIDIVYLLPKPMLFINIYLGSGCCHSKTDTTIQMKCIILSEMLDLVKHSFV